MAWSPSTSPVWKRRLESLDERSRLGLRDFGIEDSRACAANYAEILDSPELKEALVRGIITKWPRSEQTSQLRARTLMTLEELGFEREEADNVGLGCGDDSSEDSFDVGDVLRARNLDSLNAAEEEKSRKSSRPKGRTESEGHNTVIVRQKKETSPEKLT